MTYWRKFSLILFNNAKGYKLLWKNRGKCYLISVCHKYMKNPKVQVGREPFVELQAHMEALLSMLGVHSGGFPMSFGPSNKTMTSSGQTWEIPIPGHPAALKPHYAPACETKQICSDLLVVYVIFVVCIAVNKQHPITSGRDWANKNSLAWRPHRWQVREGNQSTDNFSRPHARLYI